MGPVESQGPLTAEVRIADERLRERRGQRGKGTLRSRKRTINQRVPASSRSQGQIYQPPRKCNFSLTIVGATGNLSVLETVFPGTCSLLMSTGVVLAGNPCAC